MLTAQEEFILKLHWCVYILYIFYIKVELPCKFQIMMKVTHHVKIWNHNYVLKWLFHVKNFFFKSGAQGNKEIIFQDTNYCLYKLYLEISSYSYHGCQMDNTCAFSTARCYTVVWSQRYQVLTWIQGFDRWLLCRSAALLSIPVWATHIIFDAML